MMLDGEYKSKENKENKDEVGDAGERVKANTEPEIEIIDPDNPESKNKNEKAKEVLDDTGDLI